MTLPPGVRPGDRLSLVFISREPYLQFALPADMQPEGDAFRSSGTADFIDRLLRSPSLPDRFINAPAAPLLDGPPDDPSELSLRLMQALERSGLFYESHLAQWIAGKRARHELLLEPQSRLGGSRSISSAECTDKQYLHETGFVAHAENSNHQNKAGRTPVHDEQARSEALSLIRLQLEALETRQIGWQGEGWPGQPITVEFFEEDSCTSSDTDQASANAWKTRLCVTLPTLGKVTGTLRLYAHELEVNLTGENPAVVTMLRAGAPMLSRGLESGGILLLPIGVDVDEKTGGA
jgi:hypothetical protein